MMTPNMDEARARLEALLEQFFDAAYVIVTEPEEHEKRQDRGGVLLGLVAQSLGKYLARSTDIDAVSRRKWVGILVELIRSHAYKRPTRELKDL